MRFTLAAYLFSNRLLLKEIWKSNGGFELTIGQDFIPTIVGPSVKRGLPRPLFTLSGNKAIQI